VAQGSLTASTTEQRHEARGQIANANGITSGNFPTIICGEGLCFQYGLHGDRERKTTCAETEGVSELLMPCQMDRPNS
jgi:hypothetical protein